MHSLEPLEIQQIITACLRNERLAQQQLYEWLYGKLLAVTMRYAADADDARALLNQAFLRIFHELPKYDRNRSFLAWSKGIVIHTLIDQYRKNMIYEKHLTVLHTRTETDRHAWNEALNNLAIEDIYRCIQKLPPDTRMVFSLYEVEGYRHAEIAELLAIPVGTSRWHLSNAKRLLQKMLLPLLQIL